MGSNTAGSTWATAPEGASGEEENRIIKVTAATATPTRSNADFVRIGEDFISR
jgi:hypothetical protein